MMRGITSRAPSPPASVLVHDVLPRPLLCRLRSDASAHLSPRSYGRRAPPADRFTSCTDMPELIKLGERAVTRNQFRDHRACPKWAPARLRPHRQARHPLRSGRPPRTPFKIARVNPPDAEHQDRHHPRVRHGRQPGLDEPACFRLVHHAEVISLKGDSYRLKNRNLGRIPAALARACLPALREPRHITLM